MKTIYKHKVKPKREEELSLILLIIFLEFLNINDPNFNGFLISLVYMHKDIFIDIITREKAKDIRSDNL